MSNEEKFCEELKELVNKYELSVSGTIEVGPASDGEPYISYKQGKVYLSTIYVRTSWSDQMKVATLLRSDKFTCHFLIPYTDSEYERIGVVYLEERNTALRSGTYLCVHDGDKYFVIDTTNGSLCAVITAVSITPPEIADESVIWMPVVGAHYPPNETAADCWKFFVKVTGWKNFFLTV